ILSRFQFVVPSNVPHLLGGAVGYIGYDVVRFFEPTVSIHPRDDLETPEMMFMIPRMLLVFDHRFRKLRLICNAHIDDQIFADQAYERAEASLKTTLSKLSESRVLQPVEAKPVANLPSPASNRIRAEFETMVGKAKELI